MITLSRHETHQPSTDTINYSTPGSQAALEGTVIACSGDVDIGAILRAHPVRGALRTQHRVDRAAATKQLAREGATHCIGFLIQ